MFFILSHDVVENHAPKVAIWAIGVFYLWSGVWVNAAIVVAWCGAFINLVQQYGNAAAVIATIDVLERGRQALVGLRRQVLEAFDFAI